MTKIDVVEFILDYLNENFNYLVLRNYENLPEDEGHDIDVLISQNEEPKIRTFLLLLKEKFSVDVYLNSRYKNLRSNVIVMDDYILHLDFFFYIQWLNVPFFDTEQLLSKKERYKSFFVMDVLSSERYCWFLYVIRNGKVKETYKTKALLYENNKMKDVNISLNSTNRKLRLVLYFLGKSYFGFLKGVYTSLSIKILKFFSPYGRIILDDSVGVKKCKHLDTIKGYIYIGAKEYEHDLHLLDVFKIYYLLTNEYIIILKNQKHKSSAILLNKYIVKCDNNLKSTVYNMIGKNELK